MSHLTEHIGHSYNNCFSVFACVSSGSVFIDWVFSSWWVLFSCVFECLVIFYWLPRIVIYALFCAWYFTFVLLWIFVSFVLGHSPVTWEWPDPCRSRAYVWGRAGVWLSLGFVCPTTEAGTSVHSSQCPGWESQVSQPCRWEQAPLLALCEPWSLWSLVLSSGFFLSSDGSLTCVSWTPEGALHRSLVLSLSSLPSVVPREPQLPWSSSASGSISSNWGTLQAFRGFPPCAPAWKLSKGAKLE